VKRVHLGILAILPWLASCDPVGFHEFQPTVAGRPVRSAQDQRKLRRAVDEVALQHGLKAAPIPDHFRPDPTTSAYFRTAETLAYYRRPTESKTMSLYLLRSFLDQSHEVQIYESTFLRRESKQMESEIRAKLP